MVRTEETRAPFQVTVKEYWERITLEQKNELIDEYTKIISGARPTHP